MAAKEITNTTHLNIPGLPTIKPLTPATNIKPSTKPRTPPAQLKYQMSQLFHGATKWTSSKATSTVRRRIDIVPPTNNINDTKNNRKNMCQCLSNPLPIFHPHGPLKLLWNGFIMIILLYSLIEIPYTLAFNIPISLHTVSGLISLLIDIILLIDIMLTFRTGYFDEFDTLTLITTPKLITKHYLCGGWFIIDLVMSFPFEFIFHSFTHSIKLIRIIRVIRFYKMWKKLTVKRELLVSFRLISIITLMLLYAHLSACIWYFVGCQSNKKFGVSWITQIDSIEHDCYAENIGITELTPIFEKYSYAWYWSVVTLFTTGYGDIVAQNIYEQWVASISILIGSCFFAYFIGTLTTLIGEGDGVSSYIIQKMESAQHFCDRRKLPPNLTQAILQHTKYHCNYNYIFDDAAVLTTLPPYLQTDISIYAAKQYALNSLDFFNKIIDPVVVGSIALKMRSISCNAGYKLFKQGDIAQEIYIQRTGKAIHLLSQKKNKKHKKRKIHLNRGDVVGEYALIRKKRRSTVVCNTWCEFFVIEISDILDVLRTQYPSNWTDKWLKIRKFAKETYAAQTTKNIKFKPMHCALSSNLQQQGSRSPTTKFKSTIDKNEFTDMHIASDFVQDDDNQLPNWDDYKSHSIIAPDLAAQNPFDIAITKLKPSLPIDVSSVELSEVTKFDTQHAALERLEINKIKQNNINSTKNDKKQISKRKTSFFAFNRNNSEKRDATVVAKLGQLYNEYNDYKSESESDDTAVKKFKSQRSRSLDMFNSLHYEYGKYELTAADIRVDLSELKEINTSDCLSDHESVSANTDSFGEYDDEIRNAFSFSRTMTAHSRKQLENRKATKFGKFKGVGRNKGRSSDDQFGKEFASDIMMQ